MKIFKKKDESLHSIDMPRTQSYSQGIDPRPFPRTSTIATYSKSDVGVNNNKRSVIELAKMLNCAASKLKEEEVIGKEQTFLVGGSGKDTKVRNGIMKRSSSWGGGLRKHQQHHHVRYESDISRPVLITIKDGELAGSAVARKIASQDPSENAEAMRKLKNLLMRGSGETPYQNQNQLPHKPRSRSFLFGKSARSAFPNKDVDREVSEHSNQSGSYQSGNSIPVDGSNHSAQDIARKQRWKRGLEMDKRLGGSNSATGDVFDGSRSAFSCGTSSSAGGGGETATDSMREDRTQFTHSTGGTSCYTEEDFSSLGGYSTEGTETDDSGDYSRSELRSKRDVGRRTLQSPPLLGHPGATTGIGSGQCTNRQQIMSGISEDFGIIASFLWADGSACLGTAADITKESVASCKPGS